MDIYTPEWIAIKDDGPAAQDIQLVLGHSTVNAVCFANAFSKAVEYTQNLLVNPKTLQPDVGMILHCDEEDIVVTLPADFWSEMAMFAYSLDTIKGFSYLTSTEGTTCIVMK